MERMSLEQKFPHSEEVAGRAFVQEARQNLGMNKFLLSDSFTFAPGHSFVPLSTIIEEHENPDNIPRIVKNKSEYSCTRVSVFAKPTQFLDAPGPNNTALFQEDFKSFCYMTDPTKQCGTGGPFGKEARNMSIDSPTTGTHMREEPYIVLQGLAARFETSKMQRNNKAPTRPRRRKSFGDDDKEDPIADASNQVTAAVGSKRQRA